MLIIVIVIFVVLILGPQIRPNKAQNQSPKCMLFEKQRNEATRMNCGSDALRVETSKLEQRSVGKTRSGPADPNKVRCCAVALELFLLKQRCIHIHTNGRHAVKTMAVHTRQGANQRTDDLWHSSCDLLLMRKNLQFLNVRDVLYM